ncbi:hypothetical protein A1351_23130 [Methylosinus sp. R-45379]|uniref:hypothetical protein n=1 Tax=Methylosinus sp. R-45379 TaxID=980563 RepID=UPI0007C8A28D|nr:hypothetical protein [Methylosinus sp. R-45379]OAI30018.1 hypothetical protein A1351_23130 [Methylosinus sp. R-45379]
MSDIFDRLAASAPINRGAAMATHGRGVNFEPKLGRARETWDTPPAMRPLPPDMPNFMGRSFGRLRVIGLACERGTGGKYARWVVRCVCGRYEMRRSRAVGGPHAPLDSCSYCHYLDELRFRDHVKQFGEARAVRMRDEERALVLAKARK